MGWERRKGRLFYYRKQRGEGGRVRSVYMGNGQKAIDASLTDGVPVPDELLVNRGNLEPSESARSVQVLSTAGVSDSLAQSQIAEASDLIPVPDEVAQPGGNLVELSIAPTTRKMPGVVESSAAPQMLTNADISEPGPVAQHAKKEGVTEKRELKKRERFPRLVDRRRALKQAWRLRTTSD